MIVTIQLFAFSLPVRARTQTGMRDFRTLNIWKGGIAILKQVYRLAEFLFLEEKYGLRSQICRSAVSIPSTIAACLCIGRQEGCSRSSQIDFKRFLEMALGSSFELETQLIIVEELSIISDEISDEEIKVILDQLNKEQKMINSLISKLKTNN